MTHISSRVVREVKLYQVAVCIITHTHAHTQYAFFFFFFIKSSCTVDSACDDFATGSLNVTQP